jgi:hypothetical protein
MRTVASHHIKDFAVVTSRPIGLVSPKSIDQAGFAPAEGVENRYCGANRANKDGA